MKLIRKLTSILAATSFALITALPSFAQGAEANNDVVFAIEPGAAAASTMPNGEQLDPEAMVAAGFDGPEPLFLTAANDRFRAPTAEPGNCPLFSGSMNLSDEQYEQIFSIRKASLAKNGPRIAELMSTHLELKDQLTRPDIDKSKVNALQAKIAALQTDLSNQRLQDKLNIMEIFTPQQRKELREKMLRYVGCPAMGGPGVRPHHMGGHRGYHGGYAH